MIPVRVGNEIICVAVAGARVKWVDLQNFNEFLTQYPIYHK